MNNRFCIKKNLFFLIILFIIIGSYLVFSNKLVGIKNSLSSKAAQSAEERRLRITYPRIASNIDRLKKDCKIETVPATLITDFIRTYENINDPRKLFTDTRPEVVKEAQKALGFSQYDIKDGLTEMSIYHELCVSPKANGPYKRPNDTDRFYYILAILTGRYHQISRSDQISSKSKANDFIKDVYIYATYKSPLAKSGQNGMPEITEETITISNPSQKKSFQVEVYQRFLEIADRESQPLIVKFLKGFGFDSGLSSLSILSGLYGETYEPIKWGWSGTCEAPNWKKYLKQGINNYINSFDQGSCVIDNGEFVDIREDGRIPCRVVYFKCSLLPSQISIPNSDFLGLSLLYDDYGNIPGFVLPMDIYAEEDMKDSGFWLSPLIENAADPYYFEITNRMCGEYTSYASRYAVPTIQPGQDLVSFAFEGMQSIGSVGDGSLLLLTNLCIK